MEKVNGIVIKERDYKETSKIITLITKEYGIINLLAKGARRVKSNLRINTRKLTYGEFTIIYRKDGLSTLISVDSSNSFNNVILDIKKTAYVSYLCELTKQVISQNSDMLVYDIFFDSLSKINSNLDPAVITNILELKYLDYLGVGLNLDGCSVCNSKDVITLSVNMGGYVCKTHRTSEYIVDKKTLKIIRLLKNTDIKSIKNINLSVLVKEETNKFIDEYYDKYTGLYRKSKEFIKDIENMID